METENTIEGWMLEAGGWDFEIWDFGFEIFVILS
jgi:hypothetical protein